MTDKRIREEASVKKVQPRQKFFKIFNATVILNVKIKLGGEIQVPKAKHEKNI